MKGKKLVLGAVIAVLVAGCGSSSSTSSSSGKSSSSTTGAAATAGGGANLAAARAAIAPYTGHPTAFPVDRPLGKRLPAGTKIVFMQCGTPACALFGTLIAPAIKLVGAQETVINAGSTASSSQAAASSALSLKPAAVILTGVEPSVFGGSLKRLSAAGIKVVSISIAENTKPFGITFNYIGLSSSVMAGRLMADWVIANKGAKADVAFYGVPELNYSPYMQQAFEQELSKNCPACKVRAVPIEITTLGTTAPQTIVSDLQAHPSTNTAVFATAEMASGLPAAMSSAGVHVTTIGFAPEPEQLAQIKSGQMTAALAVDFPVAVWTGVDVAARLILGEPLTPGEQAGDDPTQFLERADITFNPGKGWTGYPAFPVMFAKLWHAAP